MVRMSTVWDRTTAVLAGRAGILASIAFLTLFLPALVRNAIGLLAATSARGMGVALLGLLVSLALIVLSLWGQLAMLTVATDPQATQGDGFALASRRLPPALAVTAVLVLALVLLSIPIGLALAHSGLSMQAMQAGTAAIDPATVNAAALAFLSFYSIALGIVLLFVGVRLSLANVVVLRERRGLGAIAESWALTRGLTWRLVGVGLLFVIVLAVSASATQFVIGTIFRLLLGADAIATAAFLTSLFVTAVSTVFSVIAVVFVGQLYVAVSERAAAAS